MKEEWREIEGFPSYKVSNLGDVWSDISNIKLKQYDNGHGYLWVCLYRNNSKKEKKKFYVHRLVAGAFLKRNKNQSEVNHINYNRGENMVTNLEWSSTIHNHLHSRKRSSAAILKNHHGNLRGVHKVSRCNTWAAAIGTFGTCTHLGARRTKKEAYLLYYGAFKEWWGYEPFSLDLLKDID